MLFLLLYELSRRTVPNWANYCYEITSYHSANNKQLLIGYRYLLWLSPRKAQCLCCASQQRRSKQSHLSLLSRKLTSASKQFNLVRTLLCCWPLRQHVCGKNSMVEGVWVQQISITLLIHYWEKMRESSCHLEWRW